MMRPWRFLLLLVPAAVLLASLDTRILPLTVDRARKLRSEAESMPEKPLMHTFYGKIYGEMSDGDRDMIAAWRKAWEDSGWRTKVLGLEDAKRHPDYEKLSAIVDKLPVINYDKVCYYRWLAMAAAGGGWASDYDVVPIAGASHRAVDLSKRPTLTVYASNWSKWAVPALISGSASEWTRVVNALVKEGPAAIEKSEHLKGMIPSDMHSLMALQNKLNIHTFDNVRRGQTVLFGGRDLTKKDCDIIRGRGVHFSHKALMEGLKVEYEDIENKRPELVLKWLEMYKKTCMTSKETPVAVEKQ